jgi:hypothetical protein
MAEYSATDAGSYRVKFDREEFLELVGIAKPRVIYRRKKVYFFAFDGFVMYCDQCKNSDFTARIIDAIEFSNYPWQK